MARFDVYKYQGERVPFVVEVQASMLSELRTCVVVPLVPQRGQLPLERLHPSMQIEGINYVFMSSDISSIQRGRLGKPVLNIEKSYRQEVVDALDFLFQGF